MSTRAAGAGGGLVGGYTRKGMLTLFGGLMLAMFLASLSQTVLGAAMPTMVGELDGVDQIQWIMTAYMLGSTITMPVYGKLGDLIGRKGLMLAAIVLYIAGCVLCALASDMTMLIGGRLVQGLGAGGLMILSQAIVADVVPARDRAKYLGVMGGVFALSTVAGPLVGGWLTESLSWRWAFWVLVPLAGVALITMALFLRLPVKERTRPTVDVAGMFFLAIGTTSLVLVGTWGGTIYRWDSTLILCLIVATVVSAVLFVLCERRAVHPIMPLHLLRRRNFLLPTAAGLLNGVVMFGVLSYLPTYLQMTFGVSAIHAGLLMIPMMGFVLLTSWYTGVLVSKYGRYKWMPIVGSALIAIGLAMMGTLNPDVWVGMVCVDIAVLGTGLGMSNQILVVAVQNTFPGREVGTATAANNYFRQIGGSLGGAVIGSLLVARLHTGLMERLPADSGVTMESLTPALVRELPTLLRHQVVDAYNDALAPLFLVMAPLGLVAFVLLLFVRETPLATSVDRTPAADETASR